MLLAKAEGRGEFANIPRALPELPTELADVERVQRGLPPMMTLVTFWCR